MTRKNKFSVLFTQHVLLNRPEKPLLGLFGTWVFSLIELGNKWLHGPESKKDFWALVLMYEDFGTNLDSADQLGWEKKDTG